MTSAGIDKIGPVEPTPEDIQVQLKRILASQEFRSPTRARKFLEFVVNETLEGRRDHLKAFTIAQAVFGRDVNFDAQNDPCVRIEAGRLRRELERYYLVVGGNDPVVITVPKGGYVPFFELNSAIEPEVSVLSEELSTADEHTELDTPQPAIIADNANTPSRRPMHWLVAGVASIAFLALLAAMLPGLRSPDMKEAMATAVGSRPTVVVERFDTVSDGTLASNISEGITDEIIDKLVPFKDVVVVTDMPPRQAETAQTRPPSFALQGSVRLEGDKLRSSARLIRRADGAVIWANNYDSDLRAQGILETEAVVAKSIVSAVARPAGVMFQTGAPNMAASWDAYSCTPSYDSYRDEMTVQAHDAVKSCLQQATERSPADANAAALLSLTLLDEFRFRFKLNTKPTAATLKTAKELAERAVKLDPRNARAFLALMLANFLGNDIVAALQAGQSAYAINPKDIEVASEYGLRLSMSGKWDSGCELISAAVSKNAGPGGYYEMEMALCAFMGGDAQAAELWARMSNLDYNPLRRLILLAILGGLGKEEQAREQLDWLKLKSPELVRNVRREVIWRFARPEDQELFFAGLRAGGMQVDEQPAVN
ncbi:hypothetical protein QD460_08710 [Rhizobium jaguaris]|uniref:hypothetical protein n=1 Tax=Rhizobium jaguaris TaxID=1312183 RepID=UPI0039BF96B7